MNWIELNWSPVLFSYQSNYGYCLESIWAYFSFVHFFYQPLYWDWFQAGRGEFSAFVWKVVWGHILGGDQQMRLERRVSISVPFLWAFLDFSSEHCRGKTQKSLKKDWWILHCNTITMFRFVDEARLLQLMIPNI